MIEMDMPKIEVEENEAKSYAKITVEPLEKGFGLTIGNCLRRILLSALPGAAVQGIRFYPDGLVKHEFSAIPGVKEDVPEIILNLKTLAIQTASSDKDYEKTVHIVKEGPAVVTGGDFEQDAEIEVINKSQYICTLDEGAKLDMDVTIGRGRGYRGAGSNKNQPSATSPSIPSIRPSKRSTTTWKTRASGRISTTTSSSWKSGQTAPSPRKRSCRSRRRSCRTTSGCS